MYLLTAMGACNDAGLAHILGIMKDVLGLIQMIGPIIAIVGIVLALIKLMINPEEKKYKNLIRNWAIALVMLFILPVIVNVVMGLFDNSFSFSACWNAAFIRFII